MYILTLHEDSNANITLFENSRVVFSVAEERLSRKKHQGGFPVRSLEYMLSTFNLTLSDIDVILCGNKYHPLPRILWDRFPTYEHPFLGTAQKISLFYQHVMYHCSFLAKGVECFNKAMLKRKFGREVYLIDHHTAHAYSAYLTSGFDRALIVTTDNYGDGVASAVFEGEGGVCRKLYSSSAINSPGQFYGELAQLLGFHPLMAGKMTGLAAYGDPEKAYAAMEELFCTSSDKKNFILPLLLTKSHNRGAFRKLKKYSREDIAAAAQKRFEDVMLEYIEEALRTTGHTRIAVAGGIFGNVRLNQRIAELDIVEEIFVHPGMSDQGISLGVGLSYLTHYSQLKPFRLANVYWGPEYTDEEIKRALDDAGLSYMREEYIEKRIAEILSAGHVVARFNGRLEYGPRALGNRSILYQTTDPSVNQWLNHQLHRSEFMPFAPVTLQEYADRCYCNIQKCAYTAKFMTISVNCTDWMKRLSPGVIHVDGTARPQLIAEENNASYYTILKEYHAITGIPSLINTSFNMHEEPIVTSPADAVRAFLAARLDYLAIGNYLVKQR